MISSTLDSATARPSRIWPRSRAFAQFEARATHDHFAPVDEEVLEELLQVENARLAVDQRHHVHAEAVLQLRELEQVVEDDLRDFAALQLDHDAHAGLVRFVAQVGNALEALFAHELANPDEQIGLVHLVGNSSTMMAWRPPLSMSSMCVARG
jgi:hypothetical protein